MGSKQKLWYRSSLTLVVPGLEARRVGRIEAFGFGSKSSTDQAGETRYATKQGPIGWGVLTVTFPAADAQSWLAWRDDFMVAGNNGPGAEKSLTLTLYSSDMSTPLLVLTGTGGRDRGTAADAEHQQRVSRQIPGRPLCGAVGSEVGDQGELNPVAVGATDEI